MNPNAKAVVLLFLCVVAVGAQQPNIGGQHSMTINGVDGPPFPIINNPVRTALTATFTIRTARTSRTRCSRASLGPAGFVNGIVDLARARFRSSSRTAA